MSRFLIPKISRQLLKVVIPLGMFYFLSFLALTHFLPMPPVSYNAEAVLLALIIPFLLAGHTFWVVFFPGSNSQERIKFLSTLPVSRKRISRNNIKLFFYINGYVISFILVIGLLLFLPGLLTGMQLLRIIVISFWLITCMLFAFLVSCTLKDLNMRVAVYFLTFTVEIAPLVFLFIRTMYRPDHAFTVLMGEIVIICSLILTGLSLLVQRYNEIKLMNKDLL